MSIGLQGGNRPNEKKKKAQRNPPIMTVTRYEVRPKNNQRAKPKIETCRPRAPGEEQMRVGLEVTHVDGWLLAFNREKEGKKSETKIKQQKPEILRCFDRFGGGREENPCGLGGGDNEKRLTLKGARGPKLIKSP